MEVLAREKLLARDTFTTAAWSATVTLKKNDNGEHRLYVVCTDPDIGNMGQDSRDTLDAWRMYITVCDFLREQV